MSKILIVERERILQQALGIALFPDHEVEIRAELPESEDAGIGPYDLLIVDGSGLGARAAQAIRESKVPTLWLDESGGAQASEGDDRTVLKKPIERGALFAALERCLSPRPHAPPVRTPRKAAAQEGGGTAESSSQGELQFIDLIDVVEAPADPKAAGEKPKKAK